MDEHGNVLVDNHLKWIEQRSIGEEKARYVIGSAPSYILVPRRFDVLLGRGKTASEHTGNLRAFHIVEMNRERYEHAGKFEKTQIVRVVNFCIVQMPNAAYERIVCGKALVFTSNLSFLVLTGSIVFDRCTRLKKLSILSTKVMGDS